MSEIKNTQSSLSIILKKMKDTLDALAEAFDQAVSDPMDTTYNQIQNVSEENNKKNELVN